MSDSLLYQVEETLRARQELLQFIGGDRQSFLCGVPKPSGVLCCPLSKAP